MGPHRQLMSAFEIRLACPSHGHHEPQTGEEFGVRTGEGLLAGASKRLGAIAMPALARVLGDHRRVELRQIGQAGQIVGVVAADLRQRGRHFGAFDRIVVDEGDGIQPDVQRLRDPAHRGGLRIPADLRRAEHLLEPLR